MKSPEDDYFWAFPAQVPACLRSLGAHNLEAFDKKGVPCTRGGCAPVFAMGWAGQWAMCWAANGAGLELLRNERLWMGLGLHCEIV